MPPSFDRGKKFGRDRRQIGVLRGFPHHDGRPASRGKQRLVASVEFPEQPFHPVADDRIPEFMQYEPLGPLNVVFDIPDEALDSVFAEL